MHLTTTAPTSFNSLFSLFASFSSLDWCFFGGRAFFAPFSSGTDAGFTLTVAAEVAAAAAAAAAAMMAATD
jgi:hypothetical protein